MAEVLLIDDEELTDILLSGKYEPLIYLNISRLDGINSLFEEFLLSDIPMEESKLYQLLQSKKNNKECERWRRVRGGGRGRFGLVDNG